MNSEKINKNTTLQKNEREALIKKMVLKHQCDEIQPNLCLDDGLVRKTQFAYWRMRRQIELERLLLQ